jgi:phosphoserine phosphatase
MRLVVQGYNCLQTHLEHIASAAGGGQFRQTTPTAWRLEGTQTTEAIRVYCAAHQLDVATVPDHLTLEHVGLLVMDMDSTLIAIECIDEIADMLGLKSQVSEITESAMRGEIEFAESLRRRVALLSGLELSAVQRAYDERLQLSPGAEAMLASLKQHNVKTLLVSGGFTFFTEKLKTRLGLDFAEANDLEIVDGKLTGKVLGNILDAQGKADWLIRIRDQLGLEPDQVVAMGDGANDIKMMAAAGAGIAYHAKPIVQQQATFALNHVGLEGVVGLFSG